jgi:hypothetical protein
MKGMMRSDARKRAEKVKYQEPRRLVVIHRGSDESPRQPIEQLDYRIAQYLDS